MPCENDIFVYLPVMKFYQSLLLAFFVFALNNATAQLAFNTQHYSLEDGLPQKNIMDILQDKKGVMWFSTWHGICKFDGTDFYPYDFRKEDVSPEKGTRFDNMQMDAYSHIWLRSHDNLIYRFDPKFEHFKSIAALPALTDKSRILKIVTTAGGKIWLISDHKGYICFKDSSLTPHLFGKGGPQANDVFEDREGNSWVLTANGIYQYSKDLRNCHTYLNTAAFFSACEIDNEIWLGSAAGIVYVYHKSTGNFYQFRTGADKPIRIIRNIDAYRTLICSGDDQFLIYDQRTKVPDKFRISQLRHTPFTQIKSCYIDRQGLVWLETNEPGVSKFDPATGRLKYFKIKSDPIIGNSVSPRFMIWEDVNNYLWLQQSGGGFAYYDRGKDVLIAVADHQPDNTKHFSGTLYTGFSDRQGNLWLSASSEGLEKITFNNPIFNTIKISPAGNNNVRSILEDHLHRLWVGTKGEKITVYDSSFNRIGVLTRQGKIGEGAALSGMAYSIIEDASHNIWVGTKGRGVYKLTPDGSDNKFTVHNYLHNKADPYSLSDDKIYKIFADSHQRIWVGTYSQGLNLVDDHIDGRFYSVNNLLKNYPIKTAYHVRCIAEDHNHKLYVGTTEGLVVFPIDAGYSNFNRFKFYTQNTGRQALIGKDVYDVCVAANNQVYIATFGNGLDVVAGRNGAGYPDGFTHYSSSNGLASDLTVQIKEDLQHCLWVVSESNVSRFDPGKKAFEHYHEVGKMIKDDIFSEGGDITTTKGKIILGTTGGFLTINPSKLTAEVFRPYVALTGLQIGNHEEPVGADSPLKQEIDDIQTLVLDHTQNFLTLEFAALDFTNTRYIRYAYKLDGVDQDWLNSPEQKANYINLPPGKYTFHVRSTNGHGLWLNNEHTLNIIVVPAFWQTWWAWLIYILTALLLVFLVTRWLFIFARLKDRLRLEKEQTEMKTGFFTDISHEIRTPLTMILTPVEHILEEKKIEKPVADQLQLVLKSAKRMLRLVNQILDLRKIQYQLLTVHETNIAQLLADVTHDFAENTGLPGICLKIAPNVSEQKLWIDQDSIERLMYNLLSNAVKYSPAGKAIEVNLFLLEGKVTVQVKDHGQGMSTEVLHKLFGKFVSYNTDKTKTSTGIGLSIVKEIVDRHGAEIRVESTENRGSTFTVLFQTGNAHFAGMENIQLAKKPITTANVVIEELMPMADDHSQDTILLIEDDDDLRSFIAGLLSAKYRVLQAADGETALQMAINEIPDFVISDIMMPKMDGLAFLDRLRKQSFTSHIPLIFLTAKADQDTELAAYDRGADAFITKPFSTKMLESRIEKIMEQRKRWHDDVSHKTVSTGRPAVDLNERFLLKIKEEIEKNINSSEFSIDDLISVMPMSRTVFVKKLRSLTGQSPVEYMRTLKIKHAAMLLKSKQYTVKEVSYMVGIHDTKYFSQRFKEIIGSLPSDYKKMNG